MVLEGSDGSFGGVASVHVRWDQLERDLLFCHESFERIGRFVVHSVEHGTLASVGEILVEALERFENGSACTIF